MIRPGQRVVLCDAPWSTIGGERYPLPEFAGRAAVVVGATDVDGDVEVNLDESLRGDHYVWVAWECLRIPFEHLDAQAASDAVRAVEDAVDVHALASGYMDGEQGPAVVRALLELGWTPPSS